MNLAGVSGQVADAEADVNLPPGAGRVGKPRYLAGMNRIAAVNIVRRNQDPLPDALSHAVVKRHTVGSQIKLVHVEACGDPAILAEAGGQLRFRRDGIDDDDQFGRVRALRPDLTRPVHRADVEPIFAVGACAEEEVAFFRLRFHPRPVVPRAPSIGRHEQLDLGRFLGRIRRPWNLKRDRKQRLPPEDRWRRRGTGQRRRRVRP